MVCFTLYSVLQPSYSDFLVNEIDPNGNVVHLTDMETVPKRARPIESAQPTDEAELRELLGDDQMKILQDYVEKRQGHIMLNAIQDKQKRTQVHQLMKRLYENINSTTAADGGIRVSFEKVKRWEAGALFHTEFVMWKENKDTLEALNVIARLLK